MIYKLIGMAVVKLGWRLLRHEAAGRRGRVAGIGVAASLALIALVAGTVGYALTRETPEA